VSTRCAGSLLLALLLACKGEDDGPISTAEASEATIGGIYRSRDEVPLLDGQVTIGAENTPTDPAGLFRFPEQFPGRLVVRSDIVGWTQASNGLQMETGATTGAHLVSAPIALEPRDLGTAITLGSAALSVTFPPGSIGGGDGPATGSADFGFYQVNGPDLATPGHRIWLRADQYEEPFDAFAIIDVPSPRQGEDRLQVLAGGGATLHYEVGLDWPFADRDELSLFVFDSGDAYWLQARRVDVIDGVIDVDLGNFGWLAIGAPSAELACVRGTVALAGEPVFGAEITATEADRLGVDRVYTGADGSFCLNTLPGAVVDIDLLGWSADGNQLGTAHTSGAAAGSGCSAATSCNDLGPLPVVWVRDQDDDAFWPGQGDCDDLNLRVNPIDSGDLCIGE
jgi:hypothetical protein